MINMKVFGVFLTYLILEAFLAPISRLTDIHLMQWFIDTHSNVYICIWKHIDELKLHFLGYLGSCYYI